MKAQLTSFDRVSLVVGKLVLFFAAVNLAAWLVSLLSEEESLEEEITEL